MNSPSPPGAPAAAPSPFCTLLGSSLEAIAHELLHSRSVYPPDSFVLHRHLGVRCHASRVPQVGDYVADFLRVAVPSVMSGAADRMSLVVLEEEVSGAGGEGRGAGERTGATRTVERFDFRFQMDAAIGGVGEAKVERDRCGDFQMDIEDLHQQKDTAMKRDAELAVEARSQLERSMRECLLRVLALRRRRRRKGERAENMSFKLCLHVAEEIPPHGNDAGERSADSCPELMKALKQGEWLLPDESSCLFSSSKADGAPRQGEGLLRPLKDVDLPSCGMKMCMMMQVDPEQN
ncbi:hypothetical protein ACHAWF_018821 [Thalassiosira exigua]